MADKLYSVVMLTYNHESYISESINAIYNQDYKEPFEFIILNDASVDNTANIINDLRKFCPSHITLKVVNRPTNIGSINNFNDAIKLVNGKVVILADGDDISYSNRISHIHKLATLYSKSLYVTNAMTSEGQLKYRYNFNCSETSLSDLYSSQTPVFGASYAFEKSILMGLKIDPVWVTHNNIDQLLFWLAVKAKGVYYEKEPLLYYRIHSLSKTLNREDKNTVHDHILMKLNKIGNISYLLSFFKDDEDQKIILSHLHISLDDFNHYIFSQKENSLLSSKNIQAYFNEVGYIVCNNITYKAVWKELKKSKISELLLILDLFFLEHPLKFSEKKMILDSFRERKITKDGIMIFMIIRSNAIPLIKFGFRDYRVFIKLFIKEFFVRKNINSKVKDL